MPASGWIELVPGSNILTWFMQHQYQLPIWADEFVAEPVNCQFWDCITAILPTKCKFNTLFTTANFV